MKKCGGMYGVSVGEWESVLGCRGDVGKGMRVWWRVRGDLEFEEVWGRCVRVHEVWWRVWGTVLGCGLGGEERCGGR